MKIKLNEISVSFGDKIVLDKIDFCVNSGDKIAIIGRNGCGKTTLLKVLTNQIQVDYSDRKDKIEKDGNFKIGYLRQIAFEDGERTLSEELLTCYSEIINLKKEIEVLEEQLESGECGDKFVGYANLLEQFDYLGGYSYQKEMNMALMQFGFSGNDLTKKIKEFSGGQQTKIALIKLLLSKPDLLILDEPTNHLDLNAIIWLENYLLQYKKSIIVVSHDRAFLDKFVNVVYEIERHKIKRYVGNYSKFVEQKRMDYEKQLKNHTAGETEKKRLEELVDRFRYKASKASMAQSKLKQIERMNFCEKPEDADTKTFHINTKPLHESGNDVLNVKDLKIGYDNVLSTVNIKIQKGEKIAVIGGNGLGKSTFLKTVVKRISALGGRAIIGANVDIGYFDQQTATNNIADESVLENYQKAFPNLSICEARSDLGAFMFSQDDVFKKLTKLSGGELVRLELCKIFKTKPNFLVLDEPTNHMDIASKEALEDTLLKYAGTILFVSHDRYFVNKIASGLLVFENGQSVVYKNTTYAEYQKMKEKQQQVEKQNKDQNSDKNKDKKISKNYKEITKKIDENSANNNQIKKGENLYLKNKEENKKKLAQKKLEKEIESLEDDIKKLNENYQNPEIFSNYQKLQEIDNQIKSKNENLEKLLEKWCENN